MLEEVEADDRLHYEPALVGPFEASSREDAIEKAEQELTKF